MTVSPPCIRRNVDGLRRGVGPLLTTFVKGPSRLVGDGSSDIQARATSEASLPGVGCTAKKGDHFVKRAIAVAVAGLSLAAGSLAVASASQ